MTMAHGEPAPRDARGRPVAVIGGGWAGCAAAWTLASRGVPVVLHEATGALGGRARRVERAGLPIDNGQHLLVGAYEATRSLLWAVHGRRVDPGMRRQRLAITPFAPASGAPALATAGLPPPWNLVIAVARARGLSWDERVATLRWMSALRAARYERAAGETVDAMLDALPRRVARGIFAPLALAALNTPTARASSRVFAHLLGRISRGRGASDFLLPALDLSELLPEPAARRVEARGGEIRLRAAAVVTSATDTGVDIYAGGGRWRAAAAIVAVGPHQLAHVFAPGVTAHPDVADALEAAAAMRFEPTATIYLGFRERYRIPGRIARLDDAPGQWIFDRHDVLDRAPEAATARALEGLVAVVISAGAASDDLDARALAARVQSQLKRLDASFPVAVWSQVIVERRATFACEPGLRRPRTAAIGPRIHLAGDYLDPNLPATIEAAVASGEAAGRAIARALAAT
ncbi:Hydroxysqualene dehydroxylase [Burkholderiales bacterium]|nr:Hydroxysqualene dehydroxylase [Burkholderiales bacterium]